MKNSAVFFNNREFQLCSPACTIDDMQQDFLNLLDCIRAKAGIPLVLNSAFRSVAYEKSKGRSGKGAHTLGRAVDVRCTTTANRLRIVRAAIECGCTRIGIAASYIHMDNGDKQGLNPAVWVYNDKGQAI